MTSSAVPWSANDSPAVARIVISLPATWYVPAIACWAWVASTIAPSWLTPRRSRTANSSPPKRATRQSSTEARSRCATWTSRASPAACPLVSLTRLKPSRSMKTTEADSVDLQPLAQCGLEAEPVREPGQHVVAGGDLDPAQHLDGVADVAHREDEALRRAAALGVELAPGAVGTADLGLETVPGAGGHLLEQIGEPRMVAGLEKRGGLQGRRAAPASSRTGRSTPGSRT